MLNLEQLSELLNKHRAAAAARVKEFSVGGHPFAFNARPAIMGVINLSSDKDRVLTEAFRVLKPGGRLAVSDVVVRGGVPAEIRHSVELWMGCVAGALEESVYRDKLVKAGFHDIEIVPTRIYRIEDAKDFLAGAGLNVETLAPQMDGKFMSAFIRARKPLESEQSSA